MVKMWKWALGMVLFPATLAVAFSTGSGAATAGSQSNGAYDR